MLGRQDSNLGMPAPKAGVLPLDDAPLAFFYHTISSLLHSAAACFQLCFVRLQYPLFNQLPHLFIHWMGDVLMRTVWSFPTRHCNEVPHIALNDFHPANHESVVKRYICKSFQALFVSQCHTNFCNLHGAFLTT